MWDYGTFLALLVGRQGLGDPLGPGVVGLSPCLHPEQHGRELLQVVAIPETEVVKSLNKEQKSQKSYMV